MATTLATTRANNDVLLLLGRVLLSTIFIVSGGNKLIGIEGSAEMIASLGLPQPVIIAYVAAAFELLAGVAVLIGFFSRIAAFLLAAFCVATAILFHSAFDVQSQMTAFFKNLSIAGGFLALAGVGPGSLSVDGRS